MSNCYTESCWISVKNNTFLWGWHDVSDVYRGSNAPVICNYAPLPGSSGDYDFSPIIALLKAPHCGDKVEVIAQLFVPSPYAATIIFSTFFWDLGRQCRPRSDATKLGIWSGSTLFACRNFYLKYNKKEITTPDTPITGNGLVQLIRIDKSTRQKRVKEISRNTSPTLRGWLKSLCPTPLPRYLSPYSRGWGGAVGKGAAWLQMTGA